MWIEGIAPPEATGELKDLYERIGGARGGVAQIGLLRSAGESTSYQGSIVCTRQPSARTRATVCRRTSGPPRGNTRRDYVGRARQPDQVVTAVLGRPSTRSAPGPAMVSGLGLVVTGVTALIPLGLGLGASPSLTMLGGLGLFGVAFALNSAVHSYMVLAYSEAERVSLSVGFYYMANAAGRLMGTLLSGVLYQLAGVTASLWGASFHGGRNRGVMGCRKGED